MKIDSTTITDYAKKASDEVTNIGRNVRTSAKRSVEYVVKKTNLNKDSFTKTVQDTKKELGLVKDTAIGLATIIAAGFGAFKCVKEITEKINDLKKQ